MNADNPDLIWFLIGILGAAYGALASWLLLYVYYQNQDLKKQIRRLSGV